MTESRCFSFKKNGHITYDYPRKREVAAFSEGINKDSNNQEKK